MSRRSEKRELKKRAKSRTPVATSRSPRSSEPPAKKNSKKAPAPKSRRGVSKFTKVMVSIGLVGTLLLVGGQWIVHRSIFRVQHVTFIGMHHESASQVLRASGLDAHPTMIGITAGAIEKNLGGFPWIHHIDIVKQWPNHLIVTVHETSPVAVAFNSRKVLQYVDEYGQDLGRAPLNAPLPTLEFTNPQRPTWPYRHAGLAAAYVASQLPKAFSSQVSVISENHQGIITLQMTTPVSFVLGPDTKLKAKFVAIASVIAHSTLRPGDVVDVTVPDELAVTGPSPVG